MPITRTHLAILDLKDTKALYTTDNSFPEQMGIDIPQPIYLDESASLDEVRKADILLFNASLKILHAGWELVTTLPGAIAMIRETMTMIEKRRAILGLPYGATQSQNTKTIVYEPLAR